LNGAFTTKLNIVVLVGPVGGDVPVTVIGKVPVGVEALVEMVSVLEQVGLQEPGENVGVAPAGSPVAARLTACVAPETRVAVIVFEPDALWTTVMFPELPSE